MPQHSLLRSLKTQAWPPVCLALAVAFGMGSCSESSSSSVATETSIVIEEEREFSSDDSSHDWQAPGGVARVTVEVDDFNHGDMRIRVFDAKGVRIWQKTYNSNDWYWYIDGDYIDIDLTDDGEAGLWTIILDFDDFTGDVELTLEALDEPKPDPGVPPPEDTSPLLDATFGEDGRGTFTLDAARGRRLGLDSMGRAVVVGSLIEDNGDRRLTVWRFLANGSLDAGFGQSGAFKYEQTFASGGFDVAIDGTDQAVVSGWIAAEDEDTDLVLLRLTTSGTLDTTFGTQGVATFDDGDDDIGASVAIDSVGRVVVAGSSRDPLTDIGNALVARYTAAGIPDLTFGGTGVVRTAAAGDRGWDVALDSLDRPIVVGFREPNMVLWKFAANGVPDANFGVGGVATSSGNIGQFRVGRSLEVKGDNSIAATGIQFSNNGVDPLELALWRYAADGLPLLGFNGNGFLAYRFPNGRAAGGDVVFDASGKMLVAGATRGPDDTVETSATLWRYFDNGTVDGTLTGSDATGASRFDARAPGIRTSASALQLTAGGEALATGGAKQRDTDAVDVLIWKLLP